MVNLTRTTFGSVTCEVGVEQSAGRAWNFVAWALRVGSDGRLEPLYDEAGGIYRVTADTLPRALAKIHARLATRFGAESS